MKNIVLYYFVILLPLPFIIWAAKYDSLLFAGLLLAYVIFRGFTDAQRLYEKNVIDKKQFWKAALIPFYASTYMKELYWER